ncbi:MAG: penicillin acylase family protein [Candidatus Aminicenantes bacterium]
MKKILVTVFLSMLFLFLGFLFFFWAHFYHSLPRKKGEVSLPGLEAEVKIIIDKWGVPHIFAQNEKDLFFGCGYVHARERMWQMEFSRRTGFGRLSEVLGRNTLEVDKVLRTLGLKEAIHQDYQKLSVEMKDILRSYSRGVNSWIGSRKFNWPPEFLLLRYRPSPWSPVDSLVLKDVMALMLSFDYLTEALRGKLLNRLGTQKALQILEEGIHKTPEWRGEISLSDKMISVIFQGSNNWVVAGDHTESGKPLLANDPHLKISIPPVWYEIHLSCPTMDVTGVSLPGVPAVIIGHNHSIAWGMTYSTADVQDLYVEKLNSSRDMYLDKDGWKHLKTREEVISIKDEKEPVRINLKWTARGPLISPLVVKSQAPVSLSWTLYEGGQTLESFYRLNKAKNWDEFVDAVKLFDAPSHNFVYADREGNIGYYLSGKIPLRPEEAALFPYPGWMEEGQWQGFIKEEQKPVLFNPEDGFIVTANNRIVPPDFPHYVSCDWDAPFRANRIKDLLYQKEKHDVESFKKIQNDIYSQKAEMILPFLGEIEEASGQLNEALEIIKNWDLSFGSGKEPALYAVFMNFLHEQVFKDELREDFEKFDLFFRRKQAGLLRLLSRPSSSWFDIKGTESVEVREDILRISLEKAYQWLEREYGAPENWDWTELHSLYFKHTLGQGPFSLLFNRGPYPVDGYYFTIRASYSIKSYQVTHGASFRQIIDLSDFRNSVCVLTSGQSGHFWSRFYDNQIPLWLEGRYHPMLYDPEDIEAEAAGVLWLKPLLEE